MLTANASRPTTILRNTTGQDLTVVPARPRTRETVAMIRLSEELTTALRAVIETSPFAGLGPSKSRGSWASTRRSPAD
jgi:hypothetical protein